MRIIGRDLLEQFQKRHTDAASSLGSWLKVCQANDFKHFSDLRKTFGSADLVSPYTVFNVGGNKYRLIALINYSISTIQVAHILTHADYDKGRWRKQP